MAIGDISLSASARGNLLTLQNTAKLLGTTQSHLASGKKVNSALDNASSFFASQGFLNSANDLANLKDGLSTALQTIKAASDAISSITNAVNQLKGIVGSALQTTDATVRAGLATQYNALIDQLDSLANDATFNGTNLVNSLTSSLQVIFNASNTTSLTIAGKNLKSQGLGIGDAVGSFAVGQKAQQVTNTLTVNSTSTALTNATYSGSLTGLSVTSATATSGNGAHVTSNSTTFTDGAAVIGAEALRTKAVAAFTAASITGTETYTAADTTFARTVISGQFTATGGSASTISTTTNKLTAGATDSTGITISVGAGQTIQIDRYDGTNHTQTTYTNTTASALTFTMGATTDAVAAQGSTTAAGNLTNGAHTGTILISRTAVPDGDAANTVATALSTTAPTNGLQITTTGSSGTANATRTNLLAAGLTATRVDDDSTDGTASSNAEYTIAGQFTAIATNASDSYNSTTGRLTNAGSGVRVFVAAGDTIQAYYKPATGTNASVINYTNNTNDTISFLLGNANDYVQGLGTQTYYQTNSTVDYVLASGTVSTTGVTIANSGTINGNALVDSQSVALGGSVTTYATTAAAADATVGTTTQTGITAYDISGATLTGISGTGVTATVSGAGATTYAGSGLTISMTGARTLGGSSVTVIADAITTAQNQLTAALATLRDAASSLGNNNTLVQTRSDFTTNIISTLQTASDNLVLADTNQEGANLQALQAQSQLGIVALNISGQQAQAILRLFG